MLSSNNDFAPPDPITDHEYQFICDIVYEHSRIKLGDNKKELVMARLSKRLRKLKLKTYSEYCKMLKAPKGEEELGDLIDAISTNHTFFFRENSHFDFLKNTIIPKVAPKEKPATLRIWSAACSSGEEPYSIALLLADYYGPHSQVKWTIDCTDISTKVLKKAQDGIFTKERLEHVPPEMVVKYFQKGIGEAEGQFRVRDEIKKHLSFHHLNLLGPRYPFHEPYDVIFCRNVMIYFDRQTQTELVKKFTPLLKPHGHLLIGHAESLSGVQHELKMVKPAIYQKP